MPHQERESAIKYCPLISPQHLWIPNNRSLLAAGDLRPDGDHFKSVEGGEFVHKRCFDGCGNGTLRMIN